MKHVRIISPSGAINPEYIILAKDRLESWGYRVSIGVHALKQNGRFAGTFEERLEDLNDAFADASVDVILCSRGGYGLQQIVDRIVLPTRPKEEWPLVVGFSDITILHALMNLYGVSSLHAPMCKALAILPEDAPALQGLREALEQGPQFQETCVIGGNLSVLYGLQGTPYSLNNIIDQYAKPPVLLLEDIAERHYHVDRMLQNLRMSGVFSRVKAVLLGYFTDCNDDLDMGCTLKDSISRIVLDSDCMLIEGIPSGHEDLNIPIYLGGGLLRQK